MTQKLMAHAGCGALAAFACGFCAGHTFIEHVDSVYSPAMALAGLAAVFALFWTYHTLKRFVVSETSWQSARQFLWSCVFFAMISAMFGLQVSGVGWFSIDFLRRFGFIFWGLMTVVAIFPVRRDARRVANSRSTQS